MKLGVFTVLFGAQPLEAALDRAVEAGLDCVEIGTGNYPGDAHCRPAELLADRAALDRFRRPISSRGLEISALSCHGNPLHPQAAVARAEPRHVRPDGRAGRPPRSRPGQPVQRLPGRFRRRPIPELGDLRLADRVRRAARVAMAREGHPVLARAGGAGRRARRPARVRDASRLRRLQPAPRCSGCARRAASRSARTSIPSHLFWQGIDIETAIAELGREGAIFHTHAKDTAINPRNAALNGVLDTVPLAEVGRRSWIFRTVGYGHGELDWRRILSALRLAGYDDVLSIEHEDALLSIDEGFRKAVAFLRSVMPTEPAISEAWWT